MRLVTRSDFDESIYTILKRNNENASLRADSYMYRFLTEYQISRMKPAGTPSEFSAFKLAEEYISAHLSEEIAMGDIAASAGVSPQYLCRIFKRKTDMRPFQYINCRRLSYAKQLLTKENINSIPGQLRYRVTFSSQMRRMGADMTSEGLRALLSEVGQTYALLTALESRSYTPTTEDLTAFREELLAEQEARSFPILSQTI